MVLLKVYVCKIILELSWVILLYCISFYTVWHLIKLDFLIYFDIILKKYLLSSNLTVTIFPNYTPSITSELSIWRGAHFCPYFIILEFICYNYPPFWGVPQYLPECPHGSHASMAVKPRWQSSPYFMGNALRSKFASKN